MKLIHYGTNFFYDSYRRPIRNAGSLLTVQKPLRGTGFRCGVITEEYPHSEWINIDSNAMNLPFIKFQAEGLIIYVIEGKQNYDLLPKDQWQNINFEKLAEQYDAIYFKNNDETKACMRGRDCDCVLFLKNPYKYIKEHLNESFINFKNYQINFDTINGETKNIYIKTDRYFPEKAFLKIYNKPLNRVRGLVEKSEWRNIKYFLGLKKNEYIYEHGLLLNAKKINYILLINK